MNYIMRLLLCIAVVVLTSCIPINAEQPVQKSKMRACFTACEQKKQACQTACTMGCNECKTLRSNQAVRRYQQFVHEQAVQGGEITRTLQSFRDPLQCRNAPCDCPADYNLCKQACTGIIVKQLKPTSTCCV